MLLHANIPTYDAIDALTIVHKDYSNNQEKLKLKTSQDAYASPTTNRSELTVERAVLIHSIIIGENVNVEEIIADQFYKFVYKTDLSSSLPFPSIIAALCLEAKVLSRRIPTSLKSHQS
ncbi:hypothetical protein PIB30_040567 [Stylosanthes scabra]|uniref:Uncharacterized protein n=1 Tax=Stylosanthes scabra TaxID=79078 RepID=A0ABU6XFW9_9FABA|nr:hypothetical protein [Stylosanthes scabra]